MGSICSHDLFPFSELEAIARSLLADVGRAGVRVDRLSPRITDLWGRTDCRTFIALADPAPLWAVAHEVTHVVTGEDHDADEWQRLFVPVLTHAVTIAAQRATARLASRHDG